MTEEPPPSTVPAGWYPNAAGQQQWWDGSAWTEHVQPPTAPQVPTAVVGPATNNPARNGLGTTALVLGIVGCVLGVIPFGFTVSWILGLVGVILGFIGISRSRKGVATNGKVAIAGTVLSLLAMVIAVIATVVVFSAVDSAIQSIGTPTGESGTNASCVGLTYLDQQTTDVCAGPNGSVLLFGANVSASPFQRATDQLGSTELCTNVTITNNSTGTVAFNVFDFKLQLPSGEVQSFEFTTQSTLGSGDLVVGGSKSGAVCFPDQPAGGQNVLIYKPNAFEAARGIWLASIT